MKKALLYCLLACGIILCTVSLGDMVNKDIERDVYTSSIGRSTKISEEKIPKLIAAKQISSNQIEITYDKDVNNKMAIIPMNYWIQNTLGIIPTGISTLGKDDRISPENSLTDDKVKIESVNGSKRVYTMTFSNDIPKYDEFKIYICHVTVPGVSAYSGENGSVVIVGE